MIYEGIELKVPCYSHIFQIPAKQMLSWNAPMFGWEPANQPGKAKTLSQAESNTWLRRGIYTLCDITESIQNCAFYLMLRDKWRKTEECKRMKFSHFWRVR